MNAVERRECVRMCTSVDVCIINIDVKAHMTLLMCESQIAFDRI